jgi:hypothetical protein
VSEPQTDNQITLTLLNRDAVIGWINAVSEWVTAREPDDPGSDVVIVELVDRNAVVVLGETVTVEVDKAEMVIGRDGDERERFSVGPW